jgi:hypothetical protein
MLPSKPSMLVRMFSEKMTSGSRLWMAKVSGTALM